jgi:hypothetical protein
MAAWSKLSRLWGADGGSDSPPHSAALEYYSDGNDDNTTSNDFTTPTNFPLVQTRQELQHPRLSQEADKIDDITWQEPGLGASDNCNDGEDEEDVVRQFTTLCDGQMKHEKEIDLEPHLRADDESRELNAEVVGREVAHQEWTQQHQYRDLEVEVVTGSAYESSSEFESADDQIGRDEKASVDTDVVMQEPGEEEQLHQVQQTEDSVSHPASEQPKIKDEPNIKKEPNLEEENFLRKPLQSEAEHDDDSILGNDDDDSVLGDDDFDGQETNTVDVMSLYSQSAMVGSSIRDAAMGTPGVQEQLPTQQSLDEPATGKFQQPAPIHRDHEDHFQGSQHVMNDRGPHYNQSIPSYTGNPSKHATNDSGPKALEEPRKSSILKINLVPRKNGDARGNDGNVNVQNQMDQPSVNSNSKSDMRKGVRTQSDGMTPQQHHHSARGSTADQQKVWQSSNGLSRAPPTLFSAPSSLRSPNMPTSAHMPNSHPVVKPNNSDYIPAMESRESHLATPNSKDRQKHAIASGRSMSHNRAGAGDKRLVQNEYRQYEFKRSSGYGAMLPPPYGGPQVPFQHMHGPQYNAMYGQNPNDTWAPNYYYGVPDPYNPSFYPPPPPHHGYPTPEQAPVHPYMVAPRGSGKRKATSYVEDEEENLDIIDTDDSEDDSDNEPLVTRTKHHHNADSVSNGYASRAPIPHKLQEEVQAEPSASSTSTKVPSLPRPLPQRQSPSVRPSSPDPTAIDWKLPEYHIDPAPNDKETENPVIKITLPGCIRESLLLSMDHPEQELHLFQEIFLPAQRSLSTPDLEPCKAILNFHNICVMVLDAYYAHQVGDLVAHIPRPATSDPFAAHAAYQDQQQQKNTELDPVDRKDAREIDENEIFFATMDRWRAGLEEPVKQAYTLIRGPQEFTEIALDIIYYIKAHGMVNQKAKPKEQKESKEPKVRAERSDKGIKRGPKGNSKEGDGDDAVVKKGPGRPKGSANNNSTKAKDGKASAKGGTKAKPAQLVARKRAKTTKVAGGTISVIKPRGRK